MSVPHAEVKDTKDAETNLSEITETNVSAEKITNIGAASPETAATPKSSIALRFNLLPSHLIDALAQKKIPPAELGVYSFKYLLNKLIEQYYAQFVQNQERALIGNNMRETSMLSMDDEKEKMAVIQQLKTKYCGPNEGWSEYHVQLETAVRDLQKYIVAEIINLGKATGDPTDYMDIESNPYKRAYKVTEVGKSIGKYKTALRLLLDANTQSWPSLFDATATQHYRGHIPFRDLLGLYWLAAQDLNAKELEVKDKETNVAFAKENFIEVMSEMRRAHNEDSTLHDAVDNPSCAPGTFGRLVSSSVIYNEDARLKSNPYSSNLLRLKIGDFIAREIGKMRIDERIIIGKFLSEEVIFQLDDDEGRQFVREKVVNKLLGIASSASRLTDPRTVDSIPADSSAVEQTLNNLIEFLNQNPGEMGFILSKLTELKQTKELRATLRDMLVVHLQSLLEPKKLAPDNNLFCKILLDGVNSSLENTLKVKKKKEIEEGLKKLRTQVYDLTLEIESIAQEIQNEYAKMMLCPAYYTIGFERIEKLIEVTNDLEHNFQVYYQKTIKNFESLATSVMVDMMKNGELPGINEEYEAKVKNELDVIIKRAAESLLTSTTLKRMENIKNNIQAINECCKQQTQQILSRLPLLPGESLVYLQPTASAAAALSSSNKIKPPYADKTKDWARYCVALSLQSIQKLEQQWNQLSKEIDELELSIKTPERNMLTDNMGTGSNQSTIQSLEQRKSQLEVQKMVLHQSYEYFSGHSLLLLEDLLTVGKVKLNKQEWDEMAVMIVYLLSKLEIQKVYCLFDQNHLSKVKSLLRKYQINIDNQSEQSLSHARKLLEAGEVLLTKVELSSNLQNLRFYQEVVLETSDASLNMTDGARYIKRSRKTENPSEAEEVQNEDSAIEKQATEDSQKRQEKRSLARNKSTEGLADNLKLMSSFIQSNQQSRSEFQDLHIWLNLQQSEKSNEISEKTAKYRHELKLRAESNLNTSRIVETKTDIAPSNRRNRGRRVVVNHEGYLIRYRCINQEDIIAYRQRREAAKKKEILEIEQNKKYIEIFNKYMPILSEFGYIPLNTEWRAKPLEEYRKLASEAIREQQHSASQSLEQANVGSFRITAGIVPNQFWIVGKPESGQPIKIPVFITERGFSVRNEEGGILFIVPSFAQLKRQIQFKLDSTTPILCEHLPAKESEWVDSKAKVDTSLAFTTITNTRVEGINIERKVESDNTKQLFIFDFDITLVYEHWHELLSVGYGARDNNKRIVPFGYPSEVIFKMILNPAPANGAKISSECEDFTSNDRRLYTKGLGIRYQERTKKLFRSILSQGHHIAINSFSKYPGAIRFILRELGLTDEEISTRVFLPETNLFEESIVPADKKNSMIRLSMEYFKIVHYSQVTFVDDDSDNLFYANILNHELPLEERMTLINPIDCSTGNDDSGLYPINIHIRQDVDRNESSHQPIYLDAIDDKLDFNKQKYKAELMSLKTQIFTAIEQDNQQVLAELLQKVNTLPINIDLRVTHITFPALYHSIKHSNFAAFQFLMEQVSIPPLIDITCCSQYDVMGTASYQNRTILEQ